MAHRQLQRHLGVALSISSLLLCYLFGCLRVAGTAVYPQGVADVFDRDQSSPLDRNNLFRTENGTMIEMFPHSDSTHLQPRNHSSRRKLGDFLGCAYCKCCNLDETYCQPALPCCYSINCDTYPFGFCKFVPVSCNCVGCGI
ncbi:unnamed protein product [Calypogeia fissa]